MKRMLYLHIGTMKTGSTALQRFLAESPGALERLGCRYLADESKRLRDAWLAALKENAPPEGLSPVVEIPESGASIISYEGFSGKPVHGKSATPESVETLRRLVGLDVPVKIALYLRRQDRFIESAYNNHIKRRLESESFADFVEKLDLKRLEWNSAVIEPFAERFGRENMIVRQFEAAVGRGGIVPDFLAGVLKAEDAALMERERKRQRARYANRALSPSMLKFLREVNAGKTREEALATRRILELIDNGAGGTAYFAPEERAGILAEFAESNAEIAEEWFPESRGLWFPDLDADGNEEEWVDIDSPLSDGERAEIAGRVERVGKMARLAKKLPASIRRVLRKTLFWGKNG
jgi:hypothetical protein